MWVGEQVGKICVCVEGGGAAMRACGGVWRKEAVQHPPQGVGAACATLSKQAATHT